MDTPPPLPPATGSRRQRSPRQIRALGWLNVVIGLGLCAGMGYLVLYFRALAAHDGQPGAGVHWTAGPTMRRLTFQLLEAVFAFGVISLLGGAYQAATGRVSRVLRVLLFVAALVIIYYGYTVYRFPDPRQ